MIEIKQINQYFIVSCLIGLLLSIYAYYVERTVEEDDNYVALCDISEHMSCTKAFSSEYGKGFGLVGKLLGEDSALNQANSLGGIFFYLILAGSCFSERKSVVGLQIGLSAISNLMSIYLAYILYFVLYDFCVVCVATYVVNATNLFLSLLKWKRLNSTSEKSIPHLKSHVKQG